MNMKRIEAPTLEEAYKNAAKEFNCSITEISYEIVQHPTTGMMGLFKKTAIIIAAKKTSVVLAEMEQKVVEKEEVEKPTPNEEPKLEKESVVVSENSKKDSNKKLDILDKKLNAQNSQEDKVLESFFETNKEEKREEKVREVNVSQEESVETFSFDDDRDSPENKKRAIEIEEKLSKLMKTSCFEIDTIEVDVFKNTAHIFIDGDDAALLIGKEGYRYNALSYMLFNWINTHYNLYIKLEIAEFIQAQEEMIVNYLKPIIEHVNEKGRGKTKPLDGILVQIALEQLRAVFPNKYVAIKTGKDSRKFIIINNFNSKKDG